MYLNFLITLFLTFVKFSIQSIFYDDILIWCFLCYKQTEIQFSFNSILSGGSRAEREGNTGNTEEGTVQTTM